MGVNSATSPASPYILSVTPVNFSLTAGTNIPAPTDSPPHSRDGHDVNGLNGTALDMPGAFPVSPALQPTHRAQLSTSTTATHPNIDEALGRSGTMSPTPGGVAPSLRTARRRLFSLHSLRQSFGSSRTSLSLYQQDYPQRPPTSSGFSTAESSFGTDSKQQLRKKRSSSWFRRRSGFFTVNEDTGILDIANEDSRQGKRFKETPPMLPDIQEIVPLDDGNLGWNEDMFKKPSSISA